MTRGELLASVTGRLGSSNEARWLLDEVLGPAPSRGAASGPVPERLVARAEDLVARRSAGEPLQYVLGSWAFRSLDLQVDRRVLIPRPETEQVVQSALGVLDEVAAGRPGAVVVDLGTGSGAIALSVAVEGAAGHPGLAVWATDVDAGALEVAAANRQHLGGTHAGAAERVTLRRGDWFAALPAELRGRVDLVVSNPPYVAEAEWGSLDPGVRLEPRVALVAGPGTVGTPGLAGVEAVLAGAPEWLGRPGAVVVELAPHQAEAAAALAHGSGWREVRVATDLSGRDRVLVAWMR